MITRSTNRLLSCRGEDGLSSGIRAAVFSLASSERGIPTPRLSLCYSHSCKDLAGKNQERRRGPETGKKPMNPSPGRSKSHSGAV